MISWRAGGMVSVVSHSLHCPSVSCDLRNEPFKEWDGLPVKNLAR